MIRLQGAMRDPLVPDQLAAWVTTAELAWFLSQGTGT